jgi:TolB protein
LVAVTALLGACAASFLDEEQGTGMSLRFPSFDSTAKKTPPPPVTLTTNGSGTGTDGQNLNVRTGDPLIGLYGELVTHPTNPTWPFDGSSNVSQITFASEGAVSDPDIDTDGRWLAFASTQHRVTSDIYLKPLNGRTITQLTTDPADDVMPAFHPSGKHLAFASNRAGNWDIYFISTDGGQPVKLTDDPDPELHPSWSPDGKHLVFCKLGSRSGRWEIWVVEIDNPGVRRFLDYGLFPQWCPDPARPKILMQRGRERGSRFFSVWTVDYVNGNAVHPTEIVSAGNAAVINPAWSPDGNHIAFVTVVEPDGTNSEQIQQSDIWIVTLNGYGRTNMTNGQFTNYQPVWGRDQRVYFVSDRSGVDNIWSVTASGALDALQPGRTGVTTAPEHETYEPWIGKP